MKIKHGIVEDDLPLRGPWTRREDSPRPARPRPADSTEGRETAGKGESVEDSPLQGPWSRRKEDRVPPAGEADLPRTRRERRTAPKDGVGRPRKATVEETVRPAVEEAVFAPDVPGAAAAPVVPDAPDARESCHAGGRRGILTGLFTQKGVYQGFIMAEILGSRGGRSRRRPY